MKPSLDAFQGGSPLFARAGRAADRLSAYAGRRSPPFTPLEMGGLPRQGGIAERVANHWHTIFGPCIASHFVTLRGISIDSGSGKFR